jgi:hypothetical protein
MQLTCTRPIDPEHLQGLIKGFFSKSSSWSDKHILQTGKDFALWHIIYSF